ncbi:ATP-dependent helicase [Pseudomonas plecoglossicida]|uniref:ATP-dependent helicase n=1 Tax=Pseudomonas plecoglossicida TaxID=70775 RepID=UPI0021596FCE|nr:ATP-dependent helicase [Pseudomonas plecoglossicida]
MEQALAELKANNEQYDAAIERGHCVVLAGPGSGKTKTLTTAMARVLVDDVIDPRGVACITYNNECATELEERLARFGVANSDRCFIGTVHSFALTQILTPYVRCIPNLLPHGFRVGTSTECRTAVDVAYKSLFGDIGDVQGLWRLAEEKRRRDVDRTLPAWHGENPELASFIEAYETELRRVGLIDFDDMPLIAFRMIKSHVWIRDALRARFPVLFVDEYQDLGHALHELVLLLCFESGIRLFAVGDADQSIYGFNGANPALLQGIVARCDVKTIRLRFNYRCGTKIIKASLGALGEERDYRGVDGSPDGELSFLAVNGDYDEQAQHIANVVIPSLIGRGFQRDQIAILYRAAWLGDKIANALKETDTAILRTDGNALVRRNSRLARFVEACSRWVTGGWRDASPSYHLLLGQALAIVYGGRVSVDEEQAVSCQLIGFLRSGIERNETTHTWLLRLCRELIAPWQKIARNTHQEWEVCYQLVVRTDPDSGSDIPLNVFAGRINGSGRVTLSTLHSAKGREFDAVILFGLNAQTFPSWRDAQTERSMREARRLFYVGVTRPRKELCLIYQKGNHSPWVAELYQRSEKA